MIYAFSKEQEDYFLNNPETGMGYQVIEATRAGTYLSNKYIILNSQIAIDFDTNVGLNIKKIINEGLLSIKMSAAKSHFSNIKVLSEKEFRATVNEPTTNKGGAIDSEPGKANGTDVFVRLSAFKDDKRIDTMNNCLRPGSFTTTKKDYENCKSAKENPIERYALPSDDEIKWTFLIIPKQGDILQKGIVQEAYGKKGGGEEAFFKNGTSKNTYSPPAKPY